jgi:glycosyltransferase involved in cell wall biosynthesis
MENIKVSIIIPVYNVEKYLVQCLESVINQTLKEIEIICVNDGSTDNSTHILKEYAQMDQRIKIINKKNAGLGAARNTGMDYACGEFIGFLDSDDWVDNKMYEKLYKNAISNNSEVVMLNISLYDEFKNEYSNCEICDIAAYFDENVDFNNFIFDYTYIKPHLLNRNFAPWLKIYKTKFLKSYEDFYFPKRILFEDVPFHVQVLLRASKISFCTEKLYIYRTSNVNSISNSSGRSKKVFDIFTIVNKVENILIENKKMDEFKYEFFTFKINQLRYWFYKCDKIFKKEFFKLIKQDFENMDLKNDEMDDLNLYAQNLYQNVMNSYSYREFELREEKLQVLEKQKRDSFNELKNQKQAFEEKLQVLEKQKEIHLTN